MKVYTSTSNEITGNLNKAKDLFLDVMLTENEITKEQFEKIQQYDVVVTEKGFWGKFKDKLWKDDDGIKMTVVKHI